MTNEVVTFGCRLNIAESETIKQNLKASNLDDVVVFNSCAVTSEAERQLRQSIRKCRKENPDKKILLTGCASQVRPDYYKEMPEIDGILGNHEKLESKNYQFFDSEEKNILVSDIMQLNEVATHMATAFDGKARAFLEIQNGCNHRCTFCIIPFGRGNNRSIAMPQIIEHCNKLLVEGFNEIVLTGVDITDYGSNLPGTPKLGDLVEKILKFCPDLKRLRLSSLDVAEIDDKLMELIKFEPRLLPHFHISLQAGDNMILKRMKRRHTREEVYEFVQTVRSYREDACFGADIIVGFPTETEEMFLNSLNLVKELKIPMLHVFPYSEREGTPAAKIPAEKQVPVKVRKERGKRLRIEGQRVLQEYMKKFVGRILDVVVENDEIMRAGNFLKIKCKNNFIRGSVQNVKIIGFEKDCLIADV